MIAAACLYGATLLRVNDFSLLNSVVWSLLGLIAGVVIAAATFFLTVVETIRDRVLVGIRSNGGDERKVAVVNARFDAGIEEMRDDVQIVFLVTACAVALVFWGHADIPEIAWKWKFISKLQFIYGTVIFGVFLALSAAWDIVDMMFVLRTLDSEAVSKPRT